MDNNQPMKFCKHCGAQLPQQAVICTYCGGQVEKLETGGPSNVIYNSNQNINANANMNYGMGIYSRPLNKWVAFVLCLLLGYLGVHKFYEGKAGMGILYLFTAGLFGIGWIVDIISILTKPNPYYVRIR